jgi:hypothetical protein
VSHRATAAKNGPENKTAAPGATLETAGYARLSDRCQASASASRESETNDAIKAMIGTLGSSSSISATASSPCGAQSLRALPGG